MGPLWTMKENQYLKLVKLIRSTIAEIIIIKLFLLNYFLSEWRERNVEERLWWKTHSDPLIK